MAKRNTTKPTKSKKSSAPKPRTKENTEAVNGAFILFIQGANNKQIAKETGLSANMISEYTKSKQWKDAKDKYQSELIKALESEAIDDDITKVNTMKSVSRQLYNEALNVPTTISNKGDILKEGRKLAELALKVDGKLDESPKVNLTITEIMARGSLKKQEKGKK